MDARSQIQDFEGCRLKAYRDTLGVLTIGYGHTGLDVQSDTVWTQEHADSVFEQDYTEKLAQVRKNIPWFDRLNEPRQAVIVGMCFQLGLNGLLGFNRTLGAIRDERFADAANGMRNSRWALQTPKRVLRLAAQMENGAWN